MDGSVHNRTSLEKVTQAYFSQEKWASPWSLGESGGQYTDSVHNRTRLCLVVDMDGSVHNRTNLKKVTQAYFSQEKRGSPWSRGVVRRSVHRFSVHNRTRYVLGVWRSVHRFSTQPHKICLGVGIDGSIHNCN